MAETFPTADLNILVGWSAMLVGTLVGAVVGLFFYKDEWLGGYGSFPRRMVRLAHISFFGLGFINLFFGLTVRNVYLPETNVAVASAGFIIGVATMPLCCFLAAWRKPFRQLFPIPVLSVLTGIISILTGWP